MSAIVFPLWFIWLGSLCELLSINPVANCIKNKQTKTYFTSSDPHHDMSKFHNPLLTGEELKAWIFCCLCLFFLTDWGWFWVMKPFNLPRVCKILILTWILLPAQCSPPKTSPQGRRILFLLSWRVGYDIWWIPWVSARPFRWTALMSWSFSCQDWVFQCQKNWELQIGHFLLIEYIILYSSCCAQQNAF